MDNKTLVFEDRALAMGFTQTPTAILRDSRLSAGSRLLYSILLSYAWQDGECFPGQERLGVGMAGARRTVAGYRSGLKGAGLSRVLRRGRTATTVYEITSWSRLGSDRTPVSHHSGSDRTPVSHRDRTLVSDYEYSEDKDPEGEKESELDPVWSETLSDLELQLPRSTFNDLLAGTRVVGRENGTLIVGVRNGLAAAWLDRRLRPKIEAVLRGAAGEGLGGRFQGA